MSSGTTSDPVAGRLPRGLAVIAIAASLGASYVLDKGSGRLPDLTVLYLVPIVMTVYAFGLPAGIAVTAVALVALALAHPVAHWSLLAGDVATHFAIFLFAAVMVDRLRHQLRVIRALEAQRDFDLSIAHEVQQNMLQSTPLKDDRFDVSLTLRFSREVGGDYYRLDRLDDDLFVCVGDISGKGVSAALFAAVLNESITDGLAARGGLAPLVEMVNARMYASMPPQMFVTMFFAVLSEDSLTYVNAGHVPPLLLDADTNEIAELTQAATLPLGVAERLEPTPASLPFTSRDFLLVCTDGVTESSAVMQEPGLVASTLRSSAAESPEKVVERVARLAETGNARSDDVTVVGIRRRADSRGDRRLQPDLPGPSG